jgi:hypothetical protein
MKTILCILALLVLTASTADAYVRRTVGGGYYGRSYYAYPVARGAAVAAGAAAVAATGWGWGQPYYGYYGPYGWGGRVPGGYYGVYPYPYVTGQPTLLPRYYGW